MILALLGMGGCVNDDGSREIYSYRYFPDYSVKDTIQVDTIMSNGGPFLDTLNFSGMFTQGDKP